MRIEKLKRSKNLLEQTYTPTPGSSCLFYQVSSSCCESAGFLIASRNMRHKTRHYCSWSSTELQKSQLDETFPLCLQTQAALTDVPPMFLALWQMTGHPCCLSIFSITWGRRTGLSHKLLTWLQKTTPNNTQTSSKPESCSYKLNWRCPLVSNTI